MAFNSHKTSQASPRWLLPLLSLLGLIGCANPIPPTGGPKDTRPPGLIEEASTPNLLTNFDRRQITLTFDEWVQLKDPNQQIVISPPLTRRLDVTTKGKSVIVTLPEDEVLREETTYIINFGGAITDYNEGTALDQYKYIFSTGSFIDSLSLSGSLISSTTQEPVGDVLILLHDNLSDTAFTSLLPTYFTKTDKAGKWKIDHARSDTFRVYALKDQNLNYLFDQPGESIGFLDTLIYLPDTSGRGFQITLFDEAPLVAVVEVNRRTDGVTKVVMTRASELMRVAWIGNPGTPAWTTVNDTLMIWNTSSDTLFAEVAHADEVLDTIRINPFRGRTPANQYRQINKAIPPSGILEVMSKLPIAEIQYDSIYAIHADSIRLDSLSLTLDSTRMGMRMTYPWNQPGAYQIVALPGALQDIYGVVNDTLLFSFQVSPPGTFGQLFLNIEGLGDSVQYVLQLEQGKQLIATVVLPAGRAQPVKEVFKSLAPQTYTVRIIEDNNKNGRWDTGNFAQHRQPERVLIQTLEQLRAGWDLEATVTWK